MRLHPAIPWKWYHVYQAPFIVSIMSIGFLKWYFFDITTYIKALTSNKEPILPTKKDWMIMIVAKSFWMFIHVIWPAFNHNFLWASMTIVFALSIGSHYLYQIFIVNHIQ